LYLVDNKQLFDAFAASRQEIEKEFGEPLEWERLDDRRAYRIAVYRTGSIDDDEVALAEIRRWAIEKLLKFKKVFSSRLKQHKKSTIAN
jgi:uncharacterized protein DUF4268